MNNKGNGKVITSILVLIVIATVGIAYFFGWEIGAGMHPDKTAYSITELAELVVDDLDAGVKAATYYVKDVTEDEIMNINSCICSLNGSVYRFSVQEKTRSGIRVRFEYKISDNYYVYRKYKYNEDMQDASPAAQKLYDETVRVLDMVIKPNMSDYEKELAIHDYLVSNCEYGFVETSKEYAYSSYGALVQHKAVCNGYTEAMALLLSCVDVENDIMTGKSEGELHSWNRVCLDGKWYQLDATWDDPVPNNDKHIVHRYLNVTDDVMGIDHEWEEDKYAPCDSWDYNYFKKNNLICNYAGFESYVKSLAYVDKYGVAEIVVDDYNGGYDMQFLNGIEGISSVAYTEGEYGDYDIITVYLNEK